MLQTHLEDPGRRPVGPSRMSTTEEEAAELSHTPQSEGVRLGALNRDTTPRRCLPLSGML
jgi:hypothetical protein